jgi:hypothetical protein
MSDLVGCGIQLAPGADGPPWPRAARDIALAAEIVQVVGVYDLVLREIRADNLAPAR